MTTSYEPADPRLGRRVQHDPRSLAYAVGVLPRGAIGTVEWGRKAAIFDQGNTGSCVGNAAAGLLGHDGKNWTGLTEINVKGDTVPVDEELAVAVYSLATELDEFPGTYPPDDTGSSGLGGAKALKKLGLATGYRHAFSIGALNSALQSGPVMIGIVWLESMFTPGAGNVLTVDHRSSVAGGHELIVSGYDKPADRYTLTNSWGTGWGDEGRAYVHAADLAWLLSQDGDVTVPALTAPQPTPAVDDARLAATFRQWAAGKNL